MEGDKSKGMASQPDRHHYHDSTEELHKILSSRTLTFEQLKNLRRELEGLIGRVSFHSNRMLLEQEREPEQNE